MTRRARLRDPLDFVVAEVPLETARAPELVEYREHHYVPHYVQPDPARVVEYRQVAAWRVV